MKLDVAFAKSLLMVVMIGMGTLPLAAQEQGALEDQPAAASSEGALPGTVVPRKNGTFLSLSIEGGSFKLSFFDKDKKPMAPDIARATVRWNPSYKVGDERRVLNPDSDGQAMVSSAVRPPYRFKAYLTLLNEQGEGTESYVVDFKG